MSGVEGEGGDRWVDDVLHFWFEELNPKDWFIKSQETDDRIRERFSGVYERVAAMEPAQLSANSRDALAAIIVTDQFSRNMFRGTPRSFESDGLALETARLAVDAGFDAGLTQDQRLFLYLPFEHSEDLGDQDRAVELITALGNDRYTQYAEAHRDVIRRFGRFPHRNAVLGRESTAAEVEFLAQPGSRF